MRRIHQINNSIERTKKNKQTRDNTAKVCECIFLCVHDAVCGECITAIHYEKKILTERSQYTALRALLFYMLDYLCIMECNVCVCMCLSYSLVLFALIKCGLDGFGLSLLFSFFGLPLSLFFAFRCFMIFFGFSF